MAIAALLLAGCASTDRFANRPRPATPINLTVYVDDHRISVSPTAIGAGPVVFIVTNQASRTVSLAVHSPAGRPLADTGPINPQSTGQVTVDTSNAGDYQLSTGSATATTVPVGAIHPATLHIGRARTNADNVLLAP